MARALLLLLLAMGVATASVALILLVALEIELRLLVGYGESLPVILQLRYSGSCGNPYHTGIRSDCDFLNGVKDAFWCKLPGNGSGGGSRSGGIWSFGARGASEGQEQEEVGLLHIEHARHCMRTKQAQLTPI